MKMKKFMAFGLVGLLCMSSLTACATGGGTGKTTEQKTGVDATVIAANFQAQGLPVLKEKETYNIVTPQASALVKAGDKKCVLDTEAATNIVIDWTEIPKSGWKEKVNIMFASNDLPDAFVGTVNVANNYKQLVPLNEYIEKYAPNVQKLFEARPEYKEILTAPDGNIYSLPGGDESFENLIDSQTWINKEWLDKLGLPMPTTTDELYDVLVAFKTQDPNGNGEEDEIPLTFNGIWGHGSTLENMFGSFGVLENDQHIFIEEGKVVFSPQEQGYYEALQYMNKLYTEGLIDSSAFTQSLDQYMARGKGKDIVGIHISYSAENVVGTENRDKYVYMEPLKGPNGDQMIGINNLAKTEGFAITTACENPEVLVRYYDYINSSYDQALAWGRGPETEMWEYTDDTKENIWLLRDNMPEDYKAFGEWRNAVSFGGITPALWNIEHDQRKVVHPNDNPYTTVKPEAVKQAMQYAVEGLAPGFKSQEDTNTLALIIADLDTYLEKFVADSIMNGIDDTKWAEHLATLENLRVDEYVEICQRHQDRFN